MATQHLYPERWRAPNHRPRSAAGLTADSVLLLYQERDVSDEGGEEVVAIPEGYFRVKRTFSALGKALVALDKFEQVASSDRASVVEAARLMIAADLCDRVGRSDVSRDLRRRQEQLMLLARDVVARKRKRAKRAEPSEEVAA